MVLLLLLCVAPTATAQSKITISGTITDASNKQPLIGAAVSVEGTAIGTSTDLNGKCVGDSIPWLCSEEGED